MEEVKTIKAEREVIETTLRDPVADIGKREEKEEGREEGEGGRVEGKEEMGTREWGGGEE